MSDLYEVSFETESILSKISSIFIGERRTRNMEKCDKTFIVSFTERRLFGKHRSDSVITGE